SYSGTDRLDRFNSQLKPSRSVHREVGVKTGFWPSSRLEVALYDINTQDEIVVLSSNDGKTSYTNAAQTRRRGAEVALTVVPYPSWRFTTALNQISAEYSRSFQSGTTLIAAGNTIPGVPTAYRFAEIAWSTLAWRLEADGLRKSQAATTAALEWISADTVFANDRNDRYADGYEIANARFSHDIPLAMGTLSVLARVDNLLKRKHIGSVIVGNAYPFEPAAPRNGFLGLRYTLKLN
ncbi:MAG: Fe(3+) dicitrate transport protein FecA precursor, partial [Pseudomonadota bacterium]